MALEKRANSSRRYYYRSVRKGDRVQKIYCGPEQSLQALMAEKSLGDTADDRHHGRAIQQKLQQAKRFVRLLDDEARELTRTALVLAGYDDGSFRRLSGRPGRPPKSRKTLRERHLERLQSINVETAHELVAEAVDRLAGLRQPHEPEIAKELNQRVSVEASRIAGPGCLPTEEVLGMAIAISRLLEMAFQHYDEVMRPDRTTVRVSHQTNSLEAMLERLRRRLERVV